MLHCGAGVSPSTQYDCCFVCGDDVCDEDGVRDYSHDWLVFVLYVICYGVYCRLIFYCLTLSFNHLNTLLCSIYLLFHRHCNSVLH